VRHNIFHPVTLDSDFCDWPKGGCFPLVPYSGRIENAELRFAGRTYLLPATSSARPHALHGNAHLQTWAVSQAAKSAVMLELQSKAAESWPWSYRAQMEIVLQTQSKAVITLQLHNTDARPQPVGIGLHPYFSAPYDNLLEHNADGCWSTSGGIPSGEGPTPYSLEQLRVCLSQQSLHGVTRHLSGWRGRAAIRVSERIKLVMQASPVFHFLVVHRPRAHGYICLEPASHLANGFNLQSSVNPVTGTYILQPNQTLVGHIYLALETTD
jgi:aldose 1-epimerase